MLVITLGLMLFVSVALVSAQDEVPPASVEECVEQVAQDKPDILVEAFLQALAGADIVDREAQSVADEMEDCLQRAFQALVTIFWRGTAPGGVERLFRLDYSVWGEQFFHQLSFRTQNVEVVYRPGIADASLYTSTHGDHSDSDAIRTRASKKGSCKIGSLVIVKTKITARIGSLPCKKSTDPSTQPAPPLSTMNGISTRVSPSGLIR